MAHRFTIGVEEEFQIIDPATCELRSHVMQLVSAASPDIVEQVKHEMHQSIVETGSKICDRRRRLAHRDASHARRIGRRRRTRRSPGRRRRHASLLELDRPSHLSRRALRKHRRGIAAARAFALDLRHARSRRHARQADDHRHDEHGALLPAAPARALHQFAVLDGPQHRA